MTDAENGGSPLSDAMGHAARQLAEVAAVLAMAAQGAARARERQQHGAAVEAERLAAERASVRSLAPEVTARPLVSEGPATGAAPELVGAAATARAISGEERTVAAEGFATPDVAATRVDEHHQGVTAGIGHAQLADADAARAAALAAVAYPRPIGDALSPIPSAARPGQPVQLRRGRYR